MESENLGAAAAGELEEATEKEKQVQETANVDVNSSKTKDFGDVSQEPLEAIRSAGCNTVPVEPVRRSNSTKLSKRKRKNRKRRIKNAVSKSPEKSVNNGGTVVEPSQISDDGKEDAETDVEAESGTGEERREPESGVEQYSSVPSITITTVEGKSSTSTDIGIGTNTAPEMKNAKTFTQEEQRRSTGLLEEPPAFQYEGYPTHSVSTLLQLAKQRVASGVLRSSVDSLLEGQYESQSNSSSMYTVTEEAEYEESELEFTAPPCSPSSIHNIANESEVIIPVLEKQKSATRTVHFDERPPEIMEAHSDTTSQSLSEMNSVEKLKLETAINKLHQERLKTNTSVRPFPSKETVVLVHNVDSASATSSMGSSSLASLESAASLLKGSSSCEDFVEPSIHLPSREVLSEVPEAVITHNHNAICINSCTFEEVERFKRQNPKETIQLDEELESVIVEAMHKLPKISYQNEYYYSKDVSEPTNIKTHPRTDLESGSLAFGNPEEIFSIETKELNSSDNNNTDTIDRFKRDVNANSVGVSEEDLGRNEVSIDITSETETDEIETFSRVSSEPVFAEESQVDFEESIMSIEQDSNETIVQANEGIIAKAINVEAAVTDNANVLDKSVEEFQYSFPKNKEEKKQEMCVLNTQATHHTFYETDESELELSESVSSVMYKPTHHQIKIDSSGATTQQLNTENARRESVDVIFDINLPTPYGPNASGSGDIPIQISLPENNNFDGSDAESEIHAQQENQNSYTDTESDFPYLPQRVESLTKAIQQKEKPSNSIADAAGNQSGDEAAEQPDKQGCSCAKMCVIT